MAEEWVSASEAAKMLGVTRMTVYRLGNRKLLRMHISPIGTGPGGVRTKFLRADVEELKRKMVPEINQGDTEASP